MKKVTIYSDGGCEGNPGPGGWAAVLSFGDARKELSGGTPATTNNRMELQAAIEALAVLKEPCEIDFYTDSEYVRGGITGWINSWKRKGWKTQDRKPVKNIELWKRLDELASKHKIKWHWVRGHAGNTLNERCDQLAQEQILAIRRQFKPHELTLKLAQFRVHHTSPAAPAIPTPQIPTAAPQAHTTAAPQAPATATPLEFNFE